MGKWIVGILIALVVVFLIGGAALFFFLRQLEPNDFRPQLEEKLSEALGMEIKVAKLSLEWSGGLGFKAEGIEIRNTPEARPFVTSDWLFLRFNPLYLLKGKLIAYEFKLHSPSVFLLKKASGTNWEKKMKTPVKKSAAKPPAWIQRWTGGFALLFSMVELEQGTFVYRDETQTPVLELGVRDIEAQIEQELVGGIIRTRGTGRFFHPSKPDLNWIAVWKSFEQEVDLEVELKGEGQFKGTVLPFQKPPRFKGGLQLENFDVGRLPVAAKGFISGDVFLEGAGAGEEEIKKSLSGKGNVHVRDGAIRDVNLVRSVLARATVIPGLSEVLAEAMPPSFQTVLNSPDTHFDFVQVDFEMQGAQLVLPSLILKDSNFQIQASGTAGLEGQMDLKAQLILLDEFSEFLIHRVKELSYLENEQERIVIPFVYRGQWPRAYPQPDLAYLAQHLIVDQGARLLEKGLQALSGWGEPLPEKEQTA